MSSHAGVLQGSPAGALIAGGLATLFTSALAAAVLAGATGVHAPAAPDPPVADIPPDYLAAYAAAADRVALGEDGWAYVAAIGKVESDHGRLKAPGVREGQNAHGCCAGPMQIHNGFGEGTGTWGRFKVDGDGDSRADIYDPEDAIGTAARYLHASGAPERWRAAIFAYNHASWYVERVLEQATAYRRASASGVTTGSSGTTVVGGSGKWLRPLPGFPGERCDARIVPDVVQLVRTFGIAVTDCFGGAPHAVGGEHPLGLAIDAVPADGDWGRTLSLARSYGWSPACARAGCAGRGPFRAILYNGYPGHGDPAHAPSAHLHLSWQHAPASPFRPAAWVRVLVPPESGRKR